MTLMVVYQFTTRYEAGVGPMVYLDVVYHKKNIGNTYGEEDFIMQDIKHSLRGVDILMDLLQSSMYLC